MTDKTCWVFGCKMGTGSLEYLKMWKKCSVNGCLNFKVVKRVTREYNAIRFLVGFCQVFYCRF